MGSSTFLPLIATHVHHYQQPLPISSFSIFPRFLFPGGSLCPPCNENCLLLDGGRNDRWHQKQQHAVYPNPHHPPPPPPPSQPPSSPQLQESSGPAPSTLKPIVEISWVQGTLKSLTCWAVLTIYEDNIFISRGPAGAGLGNNTSREMKCITNHSGRRAIHVAARQTSCPESNSEWKSMSVLLPASFSCVLTSRASLGPCRGSKTVDTRQGTDCSLGVSLEDDVRVLWLSYTGLAFWRPQLPE